jgi:hypothetical protein
VPGLFSVLNIVFAALVHVEAAASAFPANAINAPRRNTIREVITMVPERCFAASCQLMTKSRLRREAVIDS